MRRPLKDRFEAKFQARAPGECWEWTGALSDGRYGSIGLDHTGRMGLAHRVSYEIYKGPIPAGLIVCHRCDNTKCVNPGHLFLGTHKDNMDDCLKKGRRAQIGETTTTAKLTEDAVREIRNTPKRKGNFLILMKKYGIGTSQLWRIRNRQAWAHIP